MAFRHFTILFVAFGLLSAAASSSSSSPTSEAQTVTSTTTEAPHSAHATSEAPHSAHATSEIPHTAHATSEIPHTAHATSEIPHTHEITTTANGTNQTNETNQNPATTTAPTPGTPAYEQTVVFEVTDLSGFIANFSESSFAESVEAGLENSSNVDLRVVAALKIKFTASYNSASDAISNVSDTLGISETDVEVQEQTRRLTSSTRRLSTVFNVVVTTGLDAAGLTVLQTAQSENSFSGVASEVSVTVQVFPIGDATPPTMDLTAATKAVDGVVIDSIDVSDMTGVLGSAPVSGHSESHDAVETSSNSDFPWVFTAALAGTVALF